MKKCLIFLLVLFHIAVSQLFGQICLTDQLEDGIGGTRIFEKGVFKAAAKWLPGQKLRVRFLNGDDHVRGKVKRYAEEWEKYANIDFVFVDSGPAEIRVAFDKGGSWSAVGKDSLRYTGASMNFGWFDSSTAETEFRRTTLHEFGHSLALLHEHQNFNRRFRWDLDEVDKKYAKLGWSKEKIHHNVVRRYDEGTEYTNKEYDPLSIMHYPVEADLTMERVAVGLNTTLSQKDIALVGEMYPLSDSSEPGPFFNSVDIEPNAYSNGESGINIRINYNVMSFETENLELVADFYKGDGTPLRDRNGKYASKDGTVAVNKDIPRSSTRNRSEILFIPVRELGLACGNSKIKMSVSILQGGKRMTTSGFSYLTYNQTCKEK